MTKEYYEGHRVQRGVFVNRHGKQIRSLRLPEQPGKYQWYDVGIENQLTLNLAYAMLVDAHGATKQPLITKDAVLAFARQVLATAPPNEFRLNVSSVRHWLKTYLKDRASGLYDCPYPEQPPCFIVVQRLGIGWSLLYHTTADEWTEIHLDNSYFFAADEACLGLSLGMLRTFNPAADDELGNSFATHLLNSRRFRNGLVVTAAEVHAFLATNQGES